MARVRRFVAVSVAFSIAALTGACGGAPTPIKPFEIKMPNLIGMSHQAAERILRADGVFDWAEPTRATRSSPPGTVIAQSPRTGDL
ncbi:MAG: PASTA domain-containing protein, partial [Marmoricola sp.]